MSTTAEHTISLDLIAQLKNKNFFQDSSCCLPLQ